MFIIYNTDLHVMGVFNGNSRYELKKELKIRIEHDKIEHEDYLNDRGNFEDRRWILVGEDYHLAFIDEYGKPMPHEMVQFKFENNKLKIIY